MNRLQVPALLVRGSESALVSTAAVAQTRRLRPDIEIVEVADADHYVPEEKPDEIAAIVTRFIAGLPA